MLISIPESVPIDVKKLPKEYQMLNLRMIFNQELYDEKIITFDIFDRMQKLLMKKMNQWMLENQHHLSSKDGKEL